jgi:hypothetical protein
VAAHLGRKIGGFSTVAGKMVRGGVAMVHHGAGQGWRRVVRATPCRCACIAVQEELCMCRNAAHALCALGSPVMSVWHGRGSVHGGSRVSAARGIGRRGRHEAGGEVTGPDTVGAALPQLGAHGGHGDGHRGRRSRAGKSLRCGGRARVLVEWRMPFGASQRWRWSKVRERGESAGRVASGSSSSPRLQPDTTRSRYVSRFPTGAAKELLVNPLGWFA